jgi:2-keto-4-pentenoate hydratase/2-oxohepta-3-ene-1,7-dioic acid hydratase in catechol pathway
VKLVYFSDGAGARRPGVLKHGEVFEIGADLLPERDSPQAMRALIDRFDSLRDRLESLPASATGRPVNQVTLHAPLPARNKVLACLGNTRPGLGEPSPVHLFLKGGTAVAGPGSTIDLANLGGREVFLADAVVGLVIKGPVHRVAASDWRKAVFGYVTLLDVAARLVGLIRWPPGSCVGATFDGFAPVAAVLVTADEIDDPLSIRVRQWNNDELRQDYRLDDMVSKPPELVETASLVTTLYSGDVIACGGDPNGQGPLQTGDRVRWAAEGVGEGTAGVSDSLNRTYDRSIRLGERVSSETSLEMIGNRNVIMAENAL